MRKHPDELSIIADEMLAVAIGGQHTICSRLRMVLKTGLVAFALLFAVADDEPVHMTAERLSTNPILRPGGQSWNEFALFNPTAIKSGSKTVLLFRAQDKNQISSIGYADSTDGLHFNVRPDGLSAQLYDHGEGRWFAYSAYPAGF